VQLLWRTVWQFLKTLSINLSYDPAIPLLGVCVCIYIHTYIHTYTLKRNENIWLQESCTQMFRASLFILAQKSTWSKCPQLMDGQTEYNVSVQRSIYYSAVREGWSTDSCHVDGPWEHFAKWRKAVTKDHNSYDSSYMKYPGEANP